jgi:cytochrome c oxidase cbb3-type subunit 1
MMAPYWLWRAIGGSMMWMSHLFFAFNFYKMVSRNHEVDIKSMAFEQIRQVSTKENEAALIN